MKPKFIIPMIGARMDYNIAKMLDQENMLDKLIIDGYYDLNRYPFLKLTDKILPSKITKSYQKYSPKVSPDKIISSWVTSLNFKAGLYFNKSGDYYNHQIKAYKALTKLAINYIKKSSSINQINVYGYDTASLELFLWIRNKNIKGHLVLEQCVAPRIQQIKMYRSFKEKLALSYSDKMIHHCSKLRERELEEWHLTDKILVPSEFVRKSVLEEGVSPEKIELVPYGYNATMPSEAILHNIEIKHSEKNKKTVILFAGNAGYRKGLHDLIDIASTLKDENVEFRIAGKIDTVFLKMMGLANVILLGKLSKESLIKEYMNADIFFFPSYLEGSALVTYEAMSWGLPIVTTQESGSTVTHSYNGFVVDAGDINKMIFHLQQLINDPTLRFQLANNAVTSIRDYSLDRYKEKLLTILSALN